MTASIFYHLCDSFNVCLFTSAQHHHFDFFFAQLIIWSSGLYILHFGIYQEWIEWVLLGVGGIVIIILQITLPGELVVQAGIAGLSFVIIVFYWIIYAEHYSPRHRIPTYYWPDFVVAIALTGAAIILFVVQNLAIIPYWIPHSLWHITAAVGQDYLLTIKPPAFAFQAAASRIKR